MLPRAICLHVHAMLRGEIDDCAIVGQWAGSKASNENLVHRGPVGGDKCWCVPRTGKGVAAGGFNNSPSIGKALV